MSVCNIQELIEAGVHFGTKSSKWHPKMAPFIHGKRLGVHIIDLKQTAASLIESFHFVSKLASQNKTILFVGTKRQARDVVRDAARSVGMPYVVERWLGGTMTNRETVRTSIKRLDQIEAEMARPDYSREGKKQQAKHARERRRILRNLEGVRNMSKLPDAIFMVDPSKEGTGLHEAQLLGIPVIGLVDTDTNPELVNLPIPGNDDGIRSIQAITNVIVEGIKHGRTQQVSKTDEKAESDQEAAKA